MISVRFAYDMKEVCLKTLYGDRSTWYRDLISWKAAFEKADDMNRFVLEVNDGVYQRCFAATGVMRRLMGEANNRESQPTANTLRAVLSVDMAHCKPPMSHGQLVMVSVWDGNDHVLIAAHGHVPTEDAREWTFALQSTKEMFPSLCENGFVILSDQDKVSAPPIQSVALTHGNLLSQGCWNAVATVLESDDVHHRACTKHLEAHILSKHGPGSGARRDLQSLFWVAAKVTNRYMCDRVLETILERHPLAHQHLTNTTYTGTDGKLKRGVPLEAWTNAYNEGRNWGKLSTAGSESGNNVALSYRRMPPPAMMKGLLMYTQERVIRVNAFFEAGQRNK